MSKSSECLQLRFEEFKNFKNMPEQLAVRDTAYMVATQPPEEAKTPPQTMKFWNVLQLLHPDFWDHQVRLAWTSICYINVGLL